MNTRALQSGRWYREPWPWLLMAGPAAVIVAGVITVYLAIASNDGLVADDYYKRGLAINQTLSRDAVARHLELRARIAFSPDFASVTVSFAGKAPPGQLMLNLAHAVRPALDKRLPLTARAGVGVGDYEAAFPALPAGRWQVTVEDAGRTWRLVGGMAAPRDAVLEIAPRQAASNGERP
jgi:uncharacterized protein